MRVALVNKYYHPPHLGGIETYLRSLAEGLAARPGVFVEAIVSNEGGETVREVIGGVEVLRLARSFAAASTPVAPGMAGAIRAAGASGPTTGSRAAGAVGPTAGGAGGRRHYGS